MRFVKFLNYLIFLVALFELLVWIMTFVIPASFKIPNCEDQPDLLAMVLSVLVIFRGIIELYLQEE